MRVRAYRRRRGPVNRRQRRRQPRRKQYGAVRAYTAKGGNPLRAVPRYIGFPTCMFAKLKFCHTNYITGGGAALYTHVYNLNSAFDFRAAIGADQPTGYDQYATIYNSCLVIAVKNNVTIVNDSATDNARVAIYSHVRVTAPNSIEDASSQKGANFVSVGPLGGNASTTKVRRYDKMSRVFGRSIFQDDTYAHTITANPTNLCYLHVSARAGDNTNNCDLKLYWKTIMYVKFYSRQLLQDA